jgi:hypothetical protein
MVDDNTLPTGQPIYRPAMIVRRFNLRDALGYDCKMFRHLWSGRFHKRRFCVLCGKRQHLERMTGFTFYRWTDTESGDEHLAMATQDIS